jgi:hypothetical protein
MPDESLSFQSNKIIVVSSGRSILLFRNKTSRPTKYKVMGTGRKPFDSGTLGVVLNGATPISIPGFLDIRIMIMGETASYTEYRFRGYAIFWRTLL